MLFLLVLVTVALNVSNAGINQLTGEERKAVLAVNMEEDNLCLQLLGQEYRLCEPVETSSQIIQGFRAQVSDYLLSIGRIFKAVIRI
jgi:hypothetical protein